ncbi:MAG: glycoside hydrolase family 99-like domain-containing protein [Phycisphaerales bacterium]
MGGTSGDNWIERVRPVNMPDLSAFLGERYLTGITGEIEAEHVHRYLFAAGLCARKDVLDIACGEGYGSALIGQVAASVVGVDIDAQTIEQARDSYGSDSIEFETGSCQEIPYKRDSFDVVVSFETIEHIEEQENFLREIKRVLRPGGLLICSTPDTGVYKAGQEPNPYHKREMSRDEFVKLLEKRFTGVRICGQRLLSGSVIARDGQSKTELLNTDDGFGFARSDASHGATYLIAVCSDGRLPRVDQSLMSDARYTIGRVTSLEAKEQELVVALNEAESVVSQRELALADASNSLDELKRAMESACAERDRSTAAREKSDAERARLAEDRGRLVSEREAAERERDSAIRDAAAANLEYERAVSVLDRVRTEMIEAREKAAAAQASEAASRAERATLVESTARSIEAKDVSENARRKAEVLSARADERAKAAERQAAVAIEQAADSACRAQAAELDRAKAESLMNDANEARTNAELNAERSRGIASSSTRELEWMRHTRSWRWSLPLRMVAAAGRAGRVKLLGLSARFVTAVGLPGQDRLRTARRAAMFKGSRLFDSGAYLRANPDIAASGVDPVWHYAAMGGVERRATGSGFDTAYYLDSNRDVAESGVHPFEHFLASGLREGRSPSPGGVAEPATKEIRVAPSNEQLDESNRPDEIEVAVRDPAPLIDVDAEQLSRTKALAFYLPQYHPIPENDAWWGKGFTEWSNVSRGRAMYRGHAQPFLPGELGFYDLRLPEVRERQAELAQAAGIHGFCYYHYWFNGRRVLERPLDDVVASASPTMPFCVCWANENWTRRWDGLEQEILLRQQHSLASDRRFILDLLPYLEDDRYIRVDGRAVILVYRPDLMTNAADTAAVWRDECMRAGIGDIHLCAVQFRTGDPRPLGFDAAVEFPPHHFPSPEITKRVAGLDPAFEGTILDYERGARELIASPRNVDYRLYRGVMPSWDNTARRMHQATIQHGATPELYEAWLRSAINQRQPDDGVRENLVFINAWNEWAEGTVLEPRRDTGDAYLQATARALGRVMPSSMPGIAVNTDEMVPADGAAGESAALSTVGVNGVRSASSIEAKIKRAVRTSPALNSFVNKHPELKSRAAGLLRGLGGNEPDAPPLPPTEVVRADVKVRWRGKASNAGGPKLVVVSHDAALAGAQLIVLENVKHWARMGVDCRVLLLGSGPLETAFAKECPTACIDDLPGVSRSNAIQIVLDNLVEDGWSPDAGFCNTVASVDAMDALHARSVPIVSAVYELPTSIEDGLGGKRTVARVMRASDRVMVASAFVRDRLAQTYSIGTELLEPVHTGVLTRPLPERPTSRAAIRRELGVGEDAIVVLGCGSIHHRKGTDLFVAAAGEAKRRANGCEIVFAWVGEDQCNATFQNWCKHDAERLGVTGTVRFVGRKDDPGAWFAGADVFALTSREDPFPMVNLEAMSAGLAVVAFDGGGGSPEVLTKELAGHTMGLVVPYADVSAMGAAIVGLAEDRDVLEGYQQRASSFAREHLGWERYMHDIGELLASCHPSFASLSGVER